MTPILSSAAKIVLSIYKSGLKSVNKTRENVTLLFWYLPFTWLAELENPVMGLVLVFQKSTGIYLTAFLLIASNSSIAL